MLSRGETPPGSCCWVASVGPWWMTAAHPDYKWSQIQGHYSLTLKGKWVVFSLVFPLPDSFKNHTAFKDSPGYEIPALGEKRQCGTHISGWRAALHLPDTRSNTSLHPQPTCRPRSHRWACSFHVFGLSGYDILGNEADGGLPFALPSLSSLGQFSWLRATSSLLGAVTMLFIYIAY